MAGVDNVTSDSAPSAVHDAWSRQYSIVCVTENLNANFRGVWYGDNPFDFVLPTVMAKIIFVSFISRLLYWILRPLKQPKFVCYVLGGILLGPSALGRKEEVWKSLFSPRESELFLTLAIIGELYSIFLVGVKMDVALVSRATKNSWRIGLSGFFSATITTTALLFCLVGQLPGILLRGSFILYVPLSLCYTFFPVLAQALEDLGLLNSELGQLAMSSAVLNDLIYWILLGLSIAFRQETMSYALMGLFSFMVLVIFSFTVLRRALISIVKRTPEGKPVKELYIVAVLLGVLLMAFVSSFIGATTILGALLLGFVIPCGPPLGSALVQKTEAIVSEFLMPLFFVRVGYSVDIRAINDWPVFIKFQIVIVAAYAAKFVGTLLTSLSCKIRFKSAVVLGLIMNIKGILELIHYHRWKSNKYIDDQTYTQLVLSTTGVTMIVTPLITLLSTRQAARLDPSHNHRGLRTLRSMVRNSEFRILCCIHSEENVHGMITLLEASNPSPASPICAYIVQTSELSGLAAPLLIPYDSRRRKLKLTFSATTDQIVRAFENYSKNSRGPVVIMPFIMVASYKTMHESVCRLSREKFIPLVIVPFHRSHRYGGGGVTATALRQFNTNVQTHAPCTVGILVDRQLSRGTASSQFSHHVAVVFIGGPDDREALAYATHMVDHQSQVTVTVVRIHLPTEKKAGRGEEEEERREREAAMDDAVAEDFRLRNVGNACATWREVEVDDMAEAMNAVRTVEGNFDLIMVGRRQSWVAATEEEELMADFLESEELGVIGDMLASSDFCGGTVSVLVLQHHMVELGARTTLRSGSAKSSSS